MARIVKGIIYLTNRSNMGFHLKNLRKSKHLSQQDLSKLSGVSCGYISEIETNKAKHVSVEIMEKIGRAHV